jgi:hypothetical protein
MVVFWIGNIGITVELILIVEAVKQGLNEGDICTGMIICDFCLNIAYFQCGYSARKLKRLYNGGIPLYSHDRCSESRSFYGKGLEGISGLPFFMQSLITVV